MWWFFSLLGILLFAVSPAVPLLICAALDIKVNEATSVLGVLPWALFFTVPIGVVALLIWLVALLWSGLRNF